MTWEACIEHTVQEAKFSNQHYRKRMHIWGSGTVCIHARGNTMLHQGRKSTINAPGNTSDRGWERQQK